MGELATRWTIRLALSLAVLAVWSAATAASESRGRRTRALWTAACGCYLAHVACAFQFYHQWSHAAAYRRTALDTAALAGLDWGGGLYVNYLFTLLWTGDVAWWWLAEDSYLRRPACLSWVWHASFAFIAFNGAVVFAKGPAMWFGLVASGLAALGAYRWLVARGRNKTSPPSRNTF
jgi:hypothetical protein